MSGDQSAVRLAVLETHNGYLLRDAQTLGSRLAAVESRLHHSETISRDVQDIQGRLHRLEGAVHLVKLAAGLMMMALAGSGVLGGSAEKAARAIGGTLLGGI